MKTRLKLMYVSMAVAMAGVSGNAGAAAFIQCPGDVATSTRQRDAVPDQVDANHPNAVCMHLTAGDGFTSMTGRVDPMYIFGFHDVTGVAENQAISAGILQAQFPAPTIAVDEGQELYLTLTNVGMARRPDLFDPHTVHFHGYSNAATYFDGEPEAGLGINMGNSITYYYKLNEPGTYMYHCHVEAAEHMQMGMLGQLYIRPKQNATGCAGNACPVARLKGGPSNAPLGYVYNDGDGSTGYDVEKPIQLGSFDGNFHDLHIGVQPLPFAEMKDDYPMMNGRGYPDTVNPASLDTVIPDSGGQVTASRRYDSLITATAGQKILVRLSNLSVTNFYTVSTLGLKMKVIGMGARQLKGPSGRDLSYKTNSVTLGGGEAMDIIIDTAGVAPGTYAFYTTNLNYLSNGSEDFGGMMTEIRIN